MFPRLRSHTTLACSTKPTAVNPSVDPAVAPASRDAAIRRDVAVAGGLAALVIAVYANSVAGTFVFDDIGAIVENRSIRDLSQIGTVLGGATMATVVDRPLLNLSLAVNYAIGGPDPWSYHVVNILIQAVNTLLLFVVARIVFSAEGMPRSLSDRATLWSALAAALWGVHPLGTAAVTYVVQRAEAIMTLWYLAGLLALARAAWSAPPIPREIESLADIDPSPRSAAVWQAVAAGCHLFGLATKEVAVTFAPIAILFDRLFLAPDWRTVVVRRGACHALIHAASTLFALRLMLFSNGRDRTAGFASGISSIEYLQSQFVFVCEYLGLAYYPVGQSVDWGVVLITDPRIWGPCLVLLIVLALATGIALWRVPRLGFAGLWWFLILAPTSSIVPLATQIAAEHRAYLPLAGLIVATVAVLRLILERLIPPREGEPESHRATVATAGLLVVAVSLCSWLTVARNALYADPLRLWIDAATNRPDNPRAYNNVMRILRDQRRYPEAITWVNQALEIPSVRATRTVRINTSEAYPSWYNNRGFIFWRMGETGKAWADFTVALTEDPSLELAWLNRAKLALELGRPREALADAMHLLAERKQIPLALTLSGRAWLRLGGAEQATAIVAVLKQMGHPLLPEFVEELRAAGIEPDDVPQPPGQI